MTYEYRQVSVTLSIASDKASRHLAREMEVTMAGTRAQMLSNMRGDNARSAGQCRRWAKWRKRKSLEGA